MSNKKEVLFLREEYGDGQGTYIYPNGEKYLGDWKNGKYHGHGTFTYHNGIMYVGEFKDGKRNGKGKLNGKNKQFSAPQIPLHKCQSDRWCAWR